MLPSVELVLCDIPPIPQLPPRTILEDDTSVVILQQENMADLLVYFDAVERCRASLN